MSKYAIALPNSLRTGICVCGLGKPAWIRTTRNQDSFGDCAPGSNKLIAGRARAMPRRPTCLRARDSTSTTLTSVARANASMPATAVVVGYQQPRSSAVLVGDVTTTPPITSISSGSTTFLCSCMPAAQWWLSWISSTALLSSTHSLPCSAAAETRHNSPAPGPQPPGLGSHHGGELSVAIDVDAWKQADVTRFQLTLGQQATRNGFPSEKWLAHRRSVACHTTGVTSVAECPASRAQASEHPASRALGTQAEPETSRG